jgi:hypothetical protein
MITCIPRALARRIVPPWGRRRSRPGFGVQLVGDRGVALGLRGAGHQLAVDLADRDLVAAMGKAGNLACHRLAMATLHRGDAGQHGEHVGGRMGVAPEQRVETVEAENLRLRKPVERVRQLMRQQMLTRGGGFGEGGR